MFKRFVHTSPHNTSPGKVHDTTPPRFKSSSQSSKDTATKVKTPWGVGFWLHIAHCSLGRDVIPWLLPCTRVGGPDHRRLHQHLPQSKSSTSRYARDLWRQHCQRVEEQLQPHFCCINGPSPQVQAPYIHIEP